MVCLFLSILVIEIRGKLKWYWSHHPCQEVNAFDFKNTIDKKSITYQLFKLTVLLVVFLDTSPSTGNQEWSQEYLCQLG